MSMGACALIGGRHLGCALPRLGTVESIYDTDHYVKNLRDEGELAGKGARLESGRHVDAIG